MNPRKVRCGLIVGSLLLGACSRAPLPPEPLRPVLTAVVGVHALSSEAVYSGEVRSRYETQLGFRIPGKIAARLVDVGAQVNTGDVLARLDSADTTLSAVAAKAQLELADADVRRYRELRGRNFVSQSALDAKETSFKATKAQADLALNQSSYTALHADHGGVVAAVSAEVGQVVAAGQTVVRVARTDALEVAIAIPEARMPEVRQLKDAEVCLWADEHACYPAALRELSRVADSVTRTYAARVAILKPDARLMLGMTANVKFRRDKTEPAPETALAVPLTAIFQQDGKPAVWIVGGDQTVSLRPVELTAFGEKTATLAGGVQAGERIVIAGVHKLSAGEKIKVVDQTAGVAE